MDFKQEYIEEVKEILKNLEKSIMELDKNPDNPEEVDNVYRYLHTVKGSAGMFDFTMMEKLTHELEFIYSDVRDGVRLLDETILDLTLHAIDILYDLLNGDSGNGGAEQLIETVINYRGGSINDTENKPASNIKVSKKQQAFSVFFRPTNNLLKRGINISGILEDLYEIDAHHLIIHNEVIPLQKQLEEKNIVSWFEILAVSGNGTEAIDDAFLLLSANDYKVLPLITEEDFQTTEYSSEIELSQDEINQRISIFKELGFDFAVQEKVEITPNVKDVVAEVSASADTDDVAIKSSSKNSKKNYHVNVATNKLDGLINIVSELVTFRSEMAHLLQDQQDNRIVEAVEKLEYLTLRLRDSAFNIRLVPINILNVKLQRLIRSTSKELNKEVEFITEGLVTELDRSIINALEAPLMHIIRNSLDHGIESPEEREIRNKPKKGLLKLYSYNSGDHVFIQIQDDGNGIDFNKIKKKGIEKGLLNPSQKYSEKDLINIMMSPGFSTADEITKVSGRGVGMDVVRKEINALRGEIDISTEDGLGTIITLRLPLTLTILDTLVVKVASQKYLIPINEIEHCYEVYHSDLFSKKSRQLNYEGQLIPFVSLREFFGHNEFPEKEIVVVVNKNDSKIALIVDKIEGQYQTVYKPLNELLQSIDCFSGASILGDGSTALILNALKLKN
ncbi:chemotaxis protein CheA [Marinigracilibium pacificum]|uniref:Chemotaxis protein CheA n=1 Tax=Marinigracilibium pacificum TaxID=2729599 RepID=A0A848ISL8_9BACT|nr:chemotaxis protein CheA [Marinigracilibium pacificum]NMM47433.1 chemotaxis protein CheA [Marinigracilibium pacificum]